MGYRIIVLMMLLNQGVMAQTNTFPASGNVGVGTVSPQTPLHVLGGSTMTAGWNKTSTLQATFPVQLFNSNNTKWAGIGYDYSTAMRFWVNSPNEDLPGYGTHGMTIMNNGNIGIGTGNPNAKLDVEGGINIAPNYFIRKSGDNAIIGYSTVLPGIVIGSGTPTDQVIINAGGSEKFRINTNGNVGIGTASPNSKLDVKGEGTTTRFTSTNGYSDLMLINSVGYGFVGSYGNSLGFYAGQGNVQDLTIKQGGNIGIGTTTPMDKLTVNGNIRAKKLIVTQSGWSDYVFAKNYKLRPLSEVENYIKANKHLPEVPSAKEVASKGINVGDTQAFLLKKIEELTLYIISQQKQINNQANAIEKLKQKK